MHTTELDAAADGIPNVGTTAHMPSDLANVTVRDYASLPGAIKSAIRIKVAHTTGFSDMTAFKHHILSYVHMTNLDGHAVKMATLNRRFRRTANQFGYKPLDIVLELTETNQLVAYTSKGSTILLSSAYTADVEHINREMHSYLKDDFECEQAIKQGIEGHLNRLYRAAE